MSVDFGELKFLLVDDSREMLSTLRSALCGFGAKQFYGAINVLKGSEVMRQQYIDVVLLNADLPEVNGLELARWIRASEDMPIQNASIIVYSDSTDQKTVARAAELGVNGFVKKPISSQMLHSRILKALEAQNKIGIAEKKHSFLYDTYRSIAGPRT